MKIENRSWHRFMQELQDFFSVKVAELFIEMSVKD